MLQVDSALQLCSSGPYPNAHWVRDSVTPLRQVSHLVSQHYYAYAPKYVEEKKDKTEYYASLSGVDSLRAQLHENRAMLPRDVNISLDEWNVWYSWYRPSSVSDGIFTALALHMIMEEADTVGIALGCHFEMVNEGAIRVLPDKAVLMAQGQVFDMMKSHQGGRLCHISQDAAVTEKDGVRTVTLINASYDEEKQVTMPQWGQVLECKRYTADTVAPPSVFTIEDVPLERTDDICRIFMPPHSLMKITFRE